jgi:hypothetical protein
MAGKSYPNIKLLVHSVLTKSKAYQTLKECRQNFIINVLLCFSSIKGRINFLQMERYTEKCDRYFKIHFENKTNFQDINLSLIKEKVSECILAFDPSHISKSGKKTYGPGSWWSGCAGRAKRGLEICGFAAVDIPHNTAFHLNAIQTPKSKDFNLLHYYCQIIRGKLPVLQRDYKLPGS